AKSAVFASLADGICVSGAMTGETVNISDLAEVKAVLPDVPVIANTGVKKENVSQILSVADGVIVGTSLKRDGITWNPVDERRVSDFMRAARG
ncbi:MAG: SgcQ protein, partial [Verrucomicrobia bacterium]|nr:SgcQ protein [Verrucomicrobiota bacterium]